MVGSPRRAIVVGDSLILEGVRAALENRLGLDVLVLDQPLDVSLAELGAYCPDAIIFDVSAIRPDLLLSLFQQPGPLLIGVDPETHQALVWSGRQAAAVATADLVQVITEAGAGSSPPNFRSAHIHPQNVRALQDDSNQGD
jgi:hypothetical protein